MSKPPSYTRPPFDNALQAWRDFLRQRNLSTDLLWIFDENLCFEHDPASPGRQRLSFQVAHTPPPADAERIAYEYFADFPAPLVFFRAGSCQGKSVCLLLCDAWFQGKNEAQGYWIRPEWLIAFRPGGPEQIEEVTDAQRWKHRLVRDRPLHDLDFCMTLRSVHEVLAHGRVLTTYEHYALKVLHLWRQILRQRDR